MHRTTTFAISLIRFTEFEPFFYESTVYDGEAIIAKQKAGYAYLSDPKNYASTEVGAFLRDVDTFIESLRVR